MPTMLLPILPGTLPAGACYATEQERLVAFADHMNALLEAGMAFYNFGDTKPAVANQGYPWFRTTDGRWYYFSGVWKSPVNYESGERRFWSGSLGALVTYDGGDAGAPGPESGPMWVEDTDFIGRSPMHPGAIPNANPAKTLSVGENYGEGAHAQTIAEMAAHTHGPASNAINFTGISNPGGSGTYNTLGGSDTTGFALTGSTGGGDAMPIIHPVRGLYVIKWSGRLFRIIP